KSEDRRPKTEDGQKTENRKPQTENHKPKTENRKTKTANRKPHGPIQRKTPPGDRTPAERPRAGEAAQDHRSRVHLPGQCRAETAAVHFGFRGGPLEAAGETPVLPG